MNGPAAVKRCTNSNVFCEHSSSCTGELEKHLNVLNQEYFDYF